MFISEKTDPSRCCLWLKPNFSFAQMSKKNKPTNPSPCLHADTLPRGKLPTPDSCITPLTSHIERTDPAAPEVVEAADASCRKRLLIRVQVEGGRVVSESSHYTEDWAPPRPSIFHLPSVHSPSSRCRAQSNKILTKLDQTAVVLFFSSPFLLLLLRLLLLLLNILSI